MAFTRPTMVNSSGLSTNGTVVTKEFFDAIFDELDTILGDPVNVTFSAGNFTASGSMTWTLAAGDQTTLRYQILNKRMTVWFALITTTVGGTPASDLLITIPASKVASAQANGTYMYQVSGVDAVGFLQIDAGGTAIRLVKNQPASLTWANSTNLTGVWGHVTFTIS